MNRVDTANELSPHSLQMLQKFEKDHQEKLEKQRAWNEADETSLVRVKNAFSRFQKFSDRHAGALTIAWAILKTIRGG